MATPDQCEGALRELAAKLASIDDATRSRHSVDRSVECTLTDLGLCFHARLESGVVVGLAEGPLPEAQVRLSLTSDDLVAVTAGELNLASAWATGRVKVDASVMDLLRLRSLF